MPGAQSSADGRSMVRVLYDGLRCCCKFRCLVIVRQHFAPERMRTALFARFSTKQWVGDRKDTAT